MWEDQVLATYYYNFMFHVEKENSSSLFLDIVVLKKDLRGTLTNFSSVWESQI